MISVCYGTKAQLIKMAPIIIELEKQGYGYQLIDTGQHAELIAEIAGDFEIRSPDVKLAGSEGGFSTIFGAGVWITRLFWCYLLRPKRVRTELFENQIGVCLVHGDTASTLVTTLLAKLGKQKVAHVEAGLRSWRIFDPFPEELIRIMVMRISDYLFAPSKESFNNLEKMNLKGDSYLLSDNTIKDTIKLHLDLKSKILFDVPEIYAIATIHRMETIYSRSSLEKIVGYIVNANKVVPVLFVLHPPTLKRLAAYGLESSLESAGVKTLPLLSHVAFLHLMRGAAFIMTDGGSVQEESYYLGTPCLLLRKGTERHEGIGQNVCLSQLEQHKVSEFINNYRDYLCEEKLGGGSPSAELVERLGEIREAARF